MTAPKKPKKCDHHKVKLITKVHGDVWICLKCKKTSNKDAFTPYELDVLIEWLLRTGKVDKK